MPDRDRARILVVDDEPGILHAISRILGRDHQLHCCRDAAAALRSVDEFEPELALVDVRMPDLDGFDLLGRLKGLRPGLDIVLMTGSIGETDAQLARAIRERAFFFLQKPFEREVLVTLVDRWRELKQLERENRAHVARLEAELEDARAVQRGMLPPERSRIGSIDVFARYRPCVELGGDFFDYAEAGGGAVAAMIADVSGHGLSAALLTGFVKSAFHTAHVDDYEPVSVARRLRNALRTGDESRFITAFAARLDAGRGRLRYVSTGHGEALLAAPGGEVQALPPTGPLISPALPEVDWRTAEVELPPGGRLLLFTDGIEETPGPDGELFGDAALRRAIADRGRAGPELLDGILAEVEQFAAGRPRRDDWSLLLLESRA